MKAVFAYAFLLLAASVGLAKADTGGAGEKSCPLTGYATGLDADCQALRADYRARIADCMARRVDDAKNRGAGEAVKSGHATRARYLLCSAEVSDRAALVVP